MVKQQVVELNKPLDVTVDAVIRRVPLEPALATVALTLHGDYYRQVQSKTNHHIVWHPLIQWYLWVIFIAATIYTFKELVEISDSVGEFLHLLRQNKYVISRYFPAMIFAAGSVGLLSFTVTDELTSISDKLASENYMAQVFRFPLKIYANAQVKDTNIPLIESASQSTDLIEYRSSPIAVVTVVPLPNQCTSTTFFAKVTGLHVRKAYRNAGVENDLLRYAKEKATSLCNRYVADNIISTTNMRIILVAEAYTVDENRIAFYEKEGFLVKNTTTKLDPFSKEKVKTYFSIVPAAPLLKLFGIYRVTFELPMENTVDVVTGSTSKETNKKAKKKV